jgi:hypothetical protein
MADMDRFKGVTLSAASLTTTFGSVTASRRGGSGVTMSSSPGVDLIKLNLGQM